ncbi:MAG: NifU family protein [Microthrixaceae bacterium]
MRDQVEAVLAILRPAIQADGGNVALISADEAVGLVQINLTGACAECPGSSATRSAAGVGRILMDRVPGVETVEQVCAGAESSTEPGCTAVSL